MAAACIRVSDHIWSFHDLDVPTLRQCQKVSKDRQLQLRPQHKVISSFSQMGDAISIRTVGLGLCTSTVKLVKDHVVDESSDELVTET